MKSLNAKRIAAIAASLAIGLVAAGPVSISNIPVINSAGQPVVQIVLGSQAKPSDGVVAANIAAVIGNLAFTSTPITATISGQSNVKCVVTTPACTLTNQKVYLSESGSVAVSAGSYTFKALIGSVLNNGAANYNTLSYTKSLQTGNTYAFPQGSTNGPFSITQSPAASAFAGLGSIPINSTTVSATTNGGGVNFAQFTYTTNYDNVLQLTSTNVPGLKSNWGAYSESESLWIQGFPVYNQKSGVQDFQFADAAGAYQVTFGTPIPLYKNLTNYASNTVNHASFSLFGTNWSVFNAAPGTGNAGAVYPTSNQFVVGGSIQLASSISPLQTVYVGHNVTAGNITVALTDLSYPNSNGISSASIQVYKNGVAENTTSINSGATKLVNVTGTPIYINVESTFPGLYAYEKWAKIQLFSNVFNVTSYPNAKSFNNNNKYWYPIVRWTTNQTSAPGTLAAFTANAELQGITLYTNEQNHADFLTKGQSLNIISSPSSWKLTFNGDSLGTPSAANSNYDSLTFTTGTGTFKYANPATSGGTSTVSFAGFGGFTNGATTQSANAVDFNGLPANVLVDLTGTGVSSISASNPLTISIQGNTLTAFATNAVGGLATGSGLKTISLTTTSNTASQTFSNSVAFNGATNNGMLISNALFNIQSITLSAPHASGTITAHVYEQFANVLIGSVPAAYGSNSIDGTVTSTATASSTQIVPASNLTEPINLFTVNSTVPSAFTVTTHTSLPALTSSPQQVQYSLNTYSYTVYNAVNTATLSGANAGTLVVLQNSGLVSGNYVSVSNPLTVTVKGFNTKGQTAPSTLSGLNAFTSFSTANVLSSTFAPFINVTEIDLSYAIPNGVTVNVYDTSNVANTLIGAGDTNAILMGSLTSVGPYLVYKQTQNTKYDYVAQPAGQGVTNAANVIYQGEGAQLEFFLNQKAAVSNTARAVYFTYNIPVVTNPQTPTTPNAYLLLGITNSTAQVGRANPYYLNWTGTYNNGFQYTSQQGNLVNASNLFRDERGDMVASVGTTGVTLDVARSVDTLEFVVGPANGTVSSTSATYGPYGVGQATNIANVSIANVTASCAFATTSCSLSGVSNLTGVPSAKQAVVSANLNTATTPIAVLDSNANNASTLVVIGSKFVNSVAAQIFAQNPSLDSSFAPGKVIVQAFGTNRILVAGYSANDTVSAGNTFIQELLTQASQ